ncbi:hypothetical protein EYF80_052540 [Liparis tanakae]|uniref:Uncharacterized protein n=1 Tax=Liparis tanakae TaxID=230148 RepID=A0A4Z2F8U4_9TELE|nr:hypothetical protein EYF80_052540 [Liparis tanakae]
MVCGGDSKLRSHSADLIRDVPIGSLVSILPLPLAERADVCPCEVFRRTSAHREIVMRCNLLHNNHHGNNNFPAALWMT